MHRSRPYDQIGSLRLGGCPGPRMGGSRAGAVNRVAVCHLPEVVEVPQAADEPYGSGSSEGRSTQGARSKSPTGSH